jgi:hypothetical protein
LIFHVGQFGQIRGDGRNGFVRIDGNGNADFGSGNHVDRAAMVGKNLKDAFEKAMRHEHARRDYIDNSDALLGGNRLENIFALGRGGRNASALAFGIAGIEN